MFKYKLYILSFFLINLSKPLTSYAQGLPTELKPQYIPTVFGETAEEQIYSLGGEIIIWITSIMGSIAVIFLIYNGLQYILAQGDEGQVASSTKNIGWIIAGLVLALLAYVIIRFVVTLVLSIDQV